MDAAALADEIRGSDRGVRYANEATPLVRVVAGKATVLHAPETKLLTPDADVICMASTCSTCLARASAADIRACTAKADCYNTYAKLMWPHIHHCSWCTSKRAPTIRLDPEAARDYTLFKKAYEAGTKAGAEGKHRASSRSSMSAHAKSNKSGTSKAAADEIARLKAALAEARKALRQLRAESPGKRSASKQGTGTARVSSKPKKKK